jgi:lysozyme
MNLDETTLKVLRVNLQREEGFREFVYNDELGIPSIGYGRNLHDVGISMPEALDLLNKDIARADFDASHFFPWYTNLDEARKYVFAAMVFQLGVGRVKGFANFLAFLEKGQYVNAAEEMLNSEWARQTPARVKRLAEVLKSGVLPTIAVP